MRKYGLFRDNPEHPARKLLAVHIPVMPTLPPASMLTQWMGKIRDQGNEGSCSGQMGAHLRDWLYRRFYIFEKYKPCAPADFMASASYIYKMNLIADGDLGQDVGSTIHQTMITLNQHGACLDKDEHYNDNDYSVAPNVTQTSEGLSLRGGAYHFLPDLMTIKASLASGYPVCFGIDVFESFERDEIANTGFMQLPKPNEGMMGRHAQFCLGYDDTLRFPDGSLGGAFIQNSWGSNWGISAPGRDDRGCYWMPYPFFAQHVQDSWMMHLGHAWK